MVNDVQRKVVLSSQHNNVVTRMMRIVFQCCFSVVILEMHIVRQFACCNAERITGVIIIASIRINLHPSGD